VSYASYVPMSPEHCVAVRAVPQNSFPAAAQLSPLRDPLADLVSELDSDGAASMSDGDSTVSSSEADTESTTSSAPSSADGSYGAELRNNTGSVTVPALQLAGPEPLGPLLSFEDHISSPYEGVSPPAQHNAYRHKMSTPQAGLSDKIPRSPTAHRELKTTQPRRPARTLRVPTDPAAADVITPPSDRTLSLAVSPEGPVQASALTVSGLETPAPFSTPFSPWPSQAPQRYRDRQVNVCAIHVSRTSQYLVCVLSQYPAK
jgi:hypothetical protein